MGVMASQITSLTIVYSTVYSGAVCRSKKTSKLRVTGLCAGNSPVASEFLAQMASNAENVSIWLRHHVPFAANCRTDTAYGFLPHSAVITCLWPWFPMIWEWFPMFLQGKNITEEIESHHWANIPQKSLTITRDFWNTNSLGWTPFHTGTHDRLSGPPTVHRFQEHLLWI